MISDEKLLKEWDYEKNSAEGFFPDKMQPYSNRKVHWKCKLGHEWICSIDKRTSGQNCPFCSNRRLLVGFNDLETKYPTVAKEWDYEKNQNILPNAIVFGSAKIVWWKCSVCGNHWQAAIRARTIRCTGCPKCSHVKMQQKRIHLRLKTKGGIQTPLLLKEWNYEKNGALSPEQFTSGSSKTVWWKCSKCSGEWQAKILNRTNGRGCPFCSNRRIMIGFNDLNTTHPQLAKEWDYEKNGALTPQMITHGSNKKVWWICPLGHSYQATPLHRGQGTNCPICNSGRQTSFAEQAFYFYIKQLYPNAINRYTEIFNNGMELDIYIPSRHIGIEYDGVFWHKKNIQREIIKYQICQSHNIKLFRIREAPLSESDWLIADRLYHIDNLDNRNNLEKQIIFFLRDLETLYTTYFLRDPDVNLQRDSLEIQKLYRQQLIGQSLDKTHPELSKEWNFQKNGDLLPSMFHSGSSERVWWKCSVCGHEWRTSISHRANGTGCEVCYRKRNYGGGHSSSKCIYQYSKEGKFIRKWDSISDAGRELHFNTSNITSCAKHLRAIAGGFRWEYSYYPQLEPMVKPNISRKGKYGKRILQFDTDGNFIKEFPSVNEATRATNIDATAISKALHGHISNAGNFIWKIKS